MKINKINNYQVFSADNKSKDAKTGEYSDPLMRWPLRGAAFTNEVGEALRPLIGGYATLSWAPALLYIGADVYDKYKNNQTEYSPNSQRCLKQAIFQGMASILLPLVAVKFGQNAFAQFGRFSKDKLSENVKEHVLSTAKEFVANGKMHKHKNNDNACREEFTEIIKNKLEFKKHQRFLNNPLNKITTYIDEKFSNHVQNINKNEKEKEFASKTINELINLRKNLINPDTKMKTSKQYEKYINYLKSGQTENVAIKTTLTDSLNKKGLSGKFIKTLGGFITLGFAIQPIDRFVENILVGKYVNNGLEKINNYNHREIIKNLS